MLIVTCKTVHRGGKRVYRVLDAPSQEERVAGNSGVDERNHLPFNLYGEVMEDCVLAVSFVCTVGRGGEGVALQADCSTAHELQLQLICLEWPEGDFGTLPKGAVESVIEVVVVDARAETENSHDPEGHSCQFLYVGMSVRKTAQWGMFVCNSFHGTVC